MQNVTVAIDCKVKTMTQMNLIHLSHLNICVLKDIQTTDKLCGIFQI